MSFIPRRLEVREIKAKENFEKNIAQYKSLHDLVYIPKNNPNHSVLEVCIAQYCDLSHFNETIMLDLWDRDVEFQQPKIYSKITQALKLIDPNEDWEFIHGLCPDKIYMAFSKKHQVGFYIKPNLGLGWPYIGTYNFYMSKEVLQFNSATTKYKTNNNKLLTLEHYLTLLISHSIRGIIIKV